LQFGCARITSAICGSVNLIFVVVFIGHISGSRLVAGLHASWSFCPHGKICFCAPNFCSSLPWLTVPLGTGAVDRFNHATKVE
jgi:hypothetical protein